MSALSEAGIEASAEVVRAELPGWLATLRLQAAWTPAELRLWAGLSVAQRARLTAAGVFSPSELTEPLSLADMVNEDLHLGVLPLCIEHGDRTDARGSASPEEAEEAAEAAAAEAAAAAAAAALRAAATVAAVTAAEAAEAARAERGGTPEPPSSHHFSACYGVQSCGKEWR
tara:strand:- start:44 stop:559 length:516 start_codon:yes stop_codon:yes gene_type:complete